ncbi:MAG: PilZ domain-containing protein [Thermodesulfobacteriota bacterium]|nr:PilZ domain-containing protein [Deltaproteobacteria bacterium]
MMESRRFIRFFSNLKARYLIQDVDRDWEECTIINASLNGMSIKFKTSRNIDVGATISLEIYVPTELEPFNLKGRLKWIAEAMDYFIGGIEYNDLLDNNEFAKLGLLLEYKEDNPDKEI